MLPMKELQEEAEIMQSLQRLKLKSLIDYKLVEDYIHKMLKDKHDGEE